MKWCHPTPAQDQSFRGEMMLWPVFVRGGKAVITPGWIFLRKPILYSWMPPLSTACWWRGRSEWRMSENRTFSGSHVARVSKLCCMSWGKSYNLFWPVKATTSGHICDKCSPLAFKWVRWHISGWVCVVLRQSPLSVVSTPSLTNIRPGAFWILHSL